MVLLVFLKRLSLSFLLRNTGSTVRKVTLHKSDPTILQCTPVNPGSPEYRQVLIHRMSLTPSDTQIAIKFTRHQFPLRLAFATTINKSQGQTLGIIGVYLPEPVFGHGMLYVALSSVRAFRDIVILIKKVPKFRPIKDEQKKERTVPYQERCIPRDAHVC